MSELRHDPLSGRDVIVAAGRAARPTTFAPSPPPTPRARPRARSVPGTRRRRPPRSPGPAAARPVPGWQRSRLPEPRTRSSRPTRSWSSRPTTRSFARPRRRRGGRGRHHVARPRPRAPCRAGHAYGVAIVNHLRGAGASIAHPHAQVFALDFVPRAVERRARTRARCGRRPRRRRRAPPTGSSIAHAAGVGVVPARVDVAVPGARRARGRRPALRPRADDTARRRSRGRDPRRAAPPRARCSATCRTTSWCTPRRATASPFHWYVDVIPRAVGGRRASNRRPASS